MEVEEGDQQGGGGYQTHNWVVRVEFEGGEREEEGDEAGGARDHHDEGAGVGEEEATECEQLAERLWVAFDGGGVFSMYTQE